MRTLVHPSIEGKVYGDTERRMIKQERKPQAQMISPPWITIGTAGVDGVDALLAANPAPYATGETPGPDPFENSWTNGFDLLPDGSTAGPLQYRYHPIFGLEVRGEPKGGATNTIICHLSDLPTLTYAIGPWDTPTVTGTGICTFFVDLDNNLNFIQQIV